MSKRGENIYKRKDGRWEGRITVCFPSSKKVSVYGKTYREVKEKLMNYQTTTLQFCNRMDTVASAILIWLSEKEKKLKTSTCVKYKNLSNKYILPRIGDVPVRKLAKEIVTNFFKVYTIVLQQKTDTTLAFSVFVTMDEKNWQKCYILCVSFFNLRRYTCRLLYRCRDLIW